MDEIILTGLSFYGYHGCLPEERQAGQPFIVDVQLSLDLRPAAQSDDLSQTIDYGELAQMLKNIVGGEAVNLLETLGTRMAEAVLAKYPLVKKVAVTVHKPRAPLAVKFTDAAVKIIRCRET